MVNITIYGSYMGLIYIERTPTPQSFGHFFRVSETPFTKNVTTPFGALTGFHRRGSLGRSQMCCHKNPYCSWIRNPAEKHQFEGTEVDHPMILPRF